MAEALAQAVVAQLDRRVASRRTGDDGALDREGGRLRPVVDGRRLAWLRGRDRDVDHVLVHEHGRDQQVAVRHPVGLEEAVVDRDVTVDLLDARGAHLGGQPIESVQRVLRCELRDTEVVGVAVVEVGHLDGVVVDPAPTEGEVALPDEHEVACERSLRIDPARAVDGCDLPVVGAQAVERRADREQLARRSGQRHPIRVEVVERLAGVDVRHQQAPGGIRVAGLGHDGLDLVRQARVGDARRAGFRGRGRARCAVRAGRARCKDQRRRQAERNHEGSSGGTRGQGGLRSSCVRWHRSSGRPEPPTTVGASAVPATTNRSEHL